MQKKDVENLISTSPLRRSSRSV